MLASVPLVVVAAPKIFLPESERDLRLYCDYVAGIQRQIFEDMQLALRDMMRKHGPIMYNDCGLELVKKAGDAIFARKFFPRPHNTYTISIPGVLETTTITPLDWG